MASGGSEIYDKNAVVKKNFLRKFGRRMGNVFARKRMARSEIFGDDPLLSPQHSPLPAGDAGGVVINPLMAPDVPAAANYQSSRSYPISVAPELRTRSGAGGGVSRSSAEFSPVQSGVSEESMTAAAPPERCLSEGNLVEAPSPPRADPLGGLGGRIWRAVPGSMDSLPKSLQTELLSKVGSRGPSVSEDEGLPHSPSDAPNIDPAASGGTGRTLGAKERPLGGPPPPLSLSARSLFSCDGSSDGEAAVPLDLDFNALRRAESLDNTAAKHKIQVSRPRKSRSSALHAPGGGLRKHKSLSTVQLSGISEEASAPSTPKPDAAPGRAPRSSEASRLAQELARELRKDKAPEKGKESAVRRPEPKPDAKAAEALAPRKIPSTATAAPTSPTATTAPAAQQPKASTAVRPASGPRPAPSDPTADAKVTRLRSMFVSGPPEALPTRAAASAEPKAASSGRLFTSGGSAAEARPSAAPKPQASASFVLNRTSGPAAPRPAAVRQLSCPDNARAPGEAAGPKKAPPGPSPAPATTPSAGAGAAKAPAGKSQQFSAATTAERPAVSSVRAAPIREKKPSPADDEPLGPTTSGSGGARPVSKVMDLVRNFQRLQETSSS